MANAEFALVFHCPVVDAFAFVFDSLAFAIAFAFDSNAFDSNAFDSNAFDSNAFDWNAIGNNALEQISIIWYNLRITRV